MIRVMIVDDQTVICEGLRVLLNADPDIEVVTTTYDGAEALRKAGQHELDVVLMDLNMPVMNGIEAVRHIRQIEQKEEREAIPIIAVTANALSSDKARFLEAGMDDYVAKTSTEKSIREILSKKM